MENPNTPPAESNEIWLISSHGFHVKLPVTQALRFVESYLGVEHTLQVFQECATGPLHVDEQRVLHRKFLSFSPWNSRLTLVEFHAVKPLPELCLQIRPEITANVFKALDSGHAAMCIALDTEEEKELAWAANRYFGIKDPILHSNNMSEGAIVDGYHRYTTANIIGQMEKHTPYSVSDQYTTQLERIMVGFIKP